jgi:hypothetical protein
MHRFKRSRVAEIRNQEADRTADLFGKPHMRMILDNSCFKLRTSRCWNVLLRKRSILQWGQAGLLSLLPMILTCSFFSLPWAKRGEAIELSAPERNGKTMSKRDMVVTPLTMEKSMMGLHLSRVITGSYESYVFKALQCSALLLQLL